MTDDEVTGDGDDVDVDDGETKAVLETCKIEMKIIDFEEAVLFGQEYPWALDHGIYTDRRYPFSLFFDHSIPRVVAGEWDNAWFETMLTGWLENDTAEDELFGEFMMSDLGVNLSEQFVQTCLDDGVVVAVVDADNQDEAEVKEVAAGLGAMDLIQAAEF